MNESHHLFFARRLLVWFICVFRILRRRWEKAKKAREDKIQEEKEAKKVAAKASNPTLGDSMWGASVEKEEEVRILSATVSVAAARRCVA